MTQKQMERDIKFFAHVHWFIYQILFSNWKISIKSIQYAHVNFTFWRIWIPTILPVKHLKTIASNLQILNNNYSPAITRTSKQYVKSAVATWRFMLTYSEWSTCVIIQTTMPVSHINFQLRNTVTFDHI
jgi:hypothetical protein